MLRRILYMFLLPALCFSCSQEGLVEKEIPSSEDALSIEIQLPGQTDSRATTEEGVGTENDITSLAVFHAVKPTDGDVDDNTNISLVTLDVPQNFKGGIIYLGKTTSIKAGDELYAVANHTFDTNPTTVGQLKTAVITDENILTATPEGISCIMSAQATATGSTNCVATFQMKRLAAKIRVHLTLIDPTTLTEANGNTLSQWGNNSNQGRSLLSNSVVKTILFPGENSDIQSDWIKSDADREYTSFAISDNKAEITAYTYRNVWQAGAAGETKVILNIPYRYNTGSGSGVENRNYYVVHFADDENKVERNMIYDITVTVNRLGSSDVTTPVKLSSGVNPYLWTNIREVELPIQNDYLYVTENSFKFITHKRLYYRASESLIAGENSYNVYFSQEGTELTPPRFEVADCTYNEDTHSGVLTISLAQVNGSYPGLMTSFDSNTPLEYYTSLVVGSIVKPLLMYQYPQVHFNVPNNDKAKTDYSHIVIEYNGGKYQIGSVTDVDEDGKIITLNQEGNQEYVSKEFVVDTDMATLIFDDKIHENARSYCLHKQTTSELWRLPTIGELKVMYEASNAAGSSWNTFQNYRYYAFGVMATTAQGAYLFDARSNSNYNSSSITSLWQNYDDSDVAVRCVRSVSSEN